MKKLIFILPFLMACSSFGIRTSTQIPYFQTGDHATINLRIDGSIDGNGVESTVPVNVDKILLEMRTQLNQMRERLEQENDDESTDAE